MKSSVHASELAEIAELNPVLAEPLQDNDPVSFIPMSAVNAETATTDAGGTRRYVEVSKGYTPFLNGDLLVAKITPCFENGKIAQARLNYRVGFGSTEFHVVRPRPSQADARYVLHFLRQERIRLEGERKMTGSAGQRRVPDHFLARLRLPLPPLTEQRRIVDVLDRAEALRAKRRAALAKLDSLTEAMFLDMFGDPIVNPRKWPRRKLSDVGTVERGVSKHRPRNAPELLDGPYPFVQTGDVANCDGYVRTFAATYSEAGLRQSRMRPAGTLCITIAANIARTGVLTFDACFPDSVVGVRSDEPATIEFVRGWLSFLQVSLEKQAPESAQKNINLKILRDLDVPLPAIQLRRHFARCIAGIETLKAAHRTSLTELDALFLSLQHRAFRGEL